MERPLSPSQFEYAREDVCHLLAMADKTVQVLKEQGRLEWALEECRMYSEQEYYVRVEREQFTRVKGASTPKPPRTGCAAAALSDSRQRS